MLKAQTLNRFLVAAFLISQSSGAQTSADKQIDGLVRDAAARQSGGAIWDNAMTAHFVADGKSLGTLTVLVHFLEPWRRLAPAELKAMNADPNRVLQETQRLNTLMNQYNQQVAKFESGGQFHGITDYLNAGLGVAQSKAEKLARFSSVSSLLGLVVDDAVEGHRQAKTGGMIANLQDNLRLMGPQAYARIYHAVHDIRLMAQKSEGLTAIVDNYSLPIAGASMKADAWEFISSSKQRLEKLIQERTLENTEYLRKQVDALSAIQAKLEKGQSISPAEATEQFRILESNLLEKLKSREAAQFSNLLTQQKNKDHADRMNRFSREAYGYTVSAFAGLVGLGDEKAGMLLGGAGNTVLTLIDVFQKSAELMADPMFVTEGQLMAAGGVITAALSVVSLLISLFTGPTIDQITLQSVQELRFQLQQLSNRMDYQFQLVHQDFQRKFFDIMQGIARLEQGNYAVMTQLSAAQVALDGLGSQWERASLLATNQMRALTAREFSLQRETCLKPRASVTDLEFRACLRFFRTCGTTYARDVIEAGDPETASGEMSELNATIVGKALEKPEVINREIRFIFQAAKKMVEASGKGTFSYEDAKLLNPTETHACSTAYLATIQLHPEHYARYHQNEPDASEEFGEMKKAGDDFDRERHKIIGGGEPTVPNLILLPTLLETYTSASQSFKAGINSRTVDLTEGEPTADLKGLNLYGIDPWASVKEQRSPVLFKRLENLTSEKINPCPGFRFHHDRPGEVPLELAPPNGMAELLLKKYPEWALMWALDLGNMKFCYSDVQWTNVEAFLRSTAHFKNGHVQKQFVASGNARFILRISSRHKEANEWRPLANFIHVSERRVDFGLMINTDGSNWSWFGTKNGGIKRNESSPAEFEDDPKTPSFLREQFAAVWEAEMKKTFAAKSTDFGAYEISFRCPFCSTEFIWDPYLHENLGEGSQHGRNIGGKENDPEPIGDIVRALLERTKGPIKKVVLSEFKTKGTKLNQLAQSMDASRSLLLALIRLGAPQSVESNLRLQSLIAGPTGLPQSRDYIIGLLRERENNAPLLHPKLYVPLVTADIERINEDIQKKKDSAVSPNRIAYLTHTLETELASNANALEGYTAPEVADKLWREAIARDLKFGEPEFASFENTKNGDRLNADYDLMLKSIALYKILHVELLAPASVANPQPESGFSAMLWLLGEFREHFARE
jgi:hypothetical protein